jgi:hypothetical protein
MAEATLHSLLKENDCLRRNRHPDGAVHGGTDELRFVTALIAEDGEARAIGIADCGVAVRSELRRKWKGR